MTAAAPDARPVRAVPALRLRRLINRLGGLRGGVDGMIGSRLLGWAAASDSERNPLRVGLFDSRGRLLAETVANLPRDDVRAAGIAGGQCGFEMTITPVIAAALRRNGGRGVLRPVGMRGQTLGHLRISGRSQQADAAAVPADGGTLGARLYSDLLLLADHVARVQAEPPDETPPPLTRVRRFLFAPTDYIRGGDLPAPLCAHMDYVRWRNRYDESFPLHPAPADLSAEELDAQFPTLGPGVGPTATAADVAGHFARFYTEFFGRARNGRRIPLPRAVLERLNAPLRLDGHGFDLTQMTWAQLADYPHLRNTMDLANPDWIFSACYWWSVHQCGQIHAEDCLVPDHYVAVLAGVPAHWQDRPWPLTRFMEQYVAESPDLAGLDREEEASRRTITLALLVRATTRPDFLRYLPPASVAALTADDGSGGSALSDFVRALAPADAAAPAFAAADWRRAMRLQGFDTDRRQFLTFTPEGDRIEAAALPLPGGERVDIQVIGPFQKASGLGQATRLSMSVLERTGYGLNAVDFGLDNPAPEGFSRVGALSGIRPARINLIHLNAESIPLVHAFEPDVFTGAWNIGYFFWELDSPAACHHLALDLLDEIWVSTRYGVSIYEKSGKLPVTNVGMCYEDLPEIPRDAARALVAARTGASPDDFVFFVAFDSFSFVQRKNPLGTIAAFLRAFPRDGGEAVRLVIKTQNRGKIADPVQIAIWDRVDALIAGDPRITLINETLDYDDLLRLKKGCDAYVSLHRSEGWGFGMIEAMNLGVPVLATAYSGNMDFCSEDTAWLVDYAEVELQPGDYIFVRPGQHWAEPDEADAARQMRALRADPAEARARAAAARDHVRQNFSADAIARRYRARLDEILGGPAKGS